MKKLVLFTCLIGISILGFAQRSMSDLKPHPTKQKSVMVEPVNESSATENPVIVEPITPSVKGVNVVTQIPIGTSGNAFGFFVDSRTASLWADNNLNSVAFTHRLTAPSSSHIGYDVSKDGGLTWSVNNINYDPTTAYPARYPMGGIYNPVGNSNPDNAYHTYVAPTLDGSHGTSGSWGGVAWGAKAFAPEATAAQTTVSTTSSQKWFLPSAFTVTQQGTAWFVDEEVNWDGTNSVYTGYITIAKGTFDDVSENFEYEYEKYPLDVHPDDGINDIEIAFAPDGQIGYISILSNLAVTLPQTSYHPIFLKTTDGGATWSDPIEVQLGGADGLEAVKNFITDEVLLEFYGEPVPDRNDIPYYIGYNHDLSVDAWGNPHIIGAVILANLDEAGIYPYEDLMANFHIWSPDGGLTWKSFNLGYQMQWEGAFTVGSNTVSHHNRPQVGTTMDGKLLFFSWLDSDVDEAADNTRPNIYFRDFIPYQGEEGTHGAEVVNVTLFSAAMWTANWGTMSHYVFSKDLGGNSIECTIPFVYMKLTDGDPILPVQFYYIPDFKRTYVVSEIDDVKSKISNVSQNFPNPFTNETYVNVQLVSGNSVGVEVYNITGQKVYEQSYGYQPAGSFTMTLKSENMPTGIYFYTVSVGTEKITRKMMVN